MGELCRTLTKPSRGLPPTRCVGESGDARLGMPLFQFLQPAHQRVVFGVGDFGLVQDVIPVFVVAKLFAKLFGFLREIFHRPLNYNLTRNRDLEKIP